MPVFVAADLGALEKAVEREQSTYRPRALIHFLRHNTLVVGSTIIYKGGGGFFFSFSFLGGGRGDFLLLLLLNADLAL